MMLATIPTQATIRRMTPSMMNSKRVKVITILSSLILYLSHGTGYWLNTLTEQRQSQSTGIS